MSRVLVVDDNPDILMITRMTFEEAGHHVVTTEDPLAVMGLLDDERPDAVVLDIMMPGVTGLDLLEEIRSRPEGQGLPVVLLTALGELHDRVKGLRSGADDYQVKPFEPEELLARVEGLISRRQVRLVPRDDAPPADAAPSESPEEKPSELLQAITRLEQAIASRRMDFSDIRLARYQVVEVLGTGAMGTVLRCWDPKLQRPVALKTIRFNDRRDRPTQVARLLSEAVANARLNHPHIVTVYDFEDEGEAAFIAMELIEGTTLESHLAAHHKIAYERLLPLAAAIAKALQAAHEKELVHRDVKPGNVLLGTDGSIKVTDFGIAEFISLGSESERIFGTPGYLAPEILSGRPATLSSDLFALGAVLYECLAGRHPFVEKNWRRTLHNTALRDPEPLAELCPGAPPRLVEVVERLLEKRIEDRPPSAAVVAALFDEMVDEGGFEWTYEISRRPRRVRETRLSTTSRLLPLAELGFAEGLA